MSELLYFAYGSNMLRERLLARCAHVRFAGCAELPDRRLAFDKLSHTDGSGKGMFQAATGARLPGVLWHLPACDEGPLDRVEGSGYERALVPVLRGDGTQVTALTYRAIDCRPGLQPFDWYLELVIAGATQQRLPADHIDWLRSVRHHRDSQHERSERVAALAALRQAGFARTA